MSFHLTFSDFPGDPFASFFGDFGFNFGGDERRNEVHKGANIVIDLYASLEEMYTGNFVEVGNFMKNDVADSNYQL